LREERLSELQRWILKTIRERGSDSQIGRYIYRRELLRSLTVARSSEVNNKEYRKQRAAANASLTRSIKSLHAKGLVKLFAAYRARSYFRTDLGRAERADALQASQSMVMKQLDALAKGASADISVEDAVIGQYESKRRLAGERAIIPREITGEPGDFDMLDLEFNRTPRIQIVALTEAVK
jgi:DNA-binding MarR family transcriptional regulator